MADYMDDRVGFVVASQPEPTHWPHDPQKRIKTSWQRLDWSSLHDQYLRSAELASSHRAGYEAMAASARSSHEELRQRRRGQLKHFDVPSINSARPRSELLGGRRTRAA